MASDRRRRPVEVRMLMQLVQPVRTRLWTWWSYTPLDPYALYVHFEAGEPNEWRFARDLLHEGLRRPTGVGDVMLGPAGRKVWLSISSPDGSATLTAPRRELAAFLRRTYAWVPSGGESAYVDLDAAVGRLLYGGAAC